jgi:IS30 family transposase
LRPKRCHLAGNRKLPNIVASKLVLDWSPEQISGWLKTQYPDDESMRVSHDTIYRSLFIQARGSASLINASVLSGLSTVPNLYVIFDDSIRCRGVI